MCMGKTACLPVLLALALLPALSLYAQEIGKQQDLTSLLSAKKLCVETFVGAEVLAGQAREMAFASLFASKRFALTENCGKADVVMKGAVIQEGEQQVRSESESTNFGVLAGGATANSSGGTAAVGASKGGSSEALTSAETVTQASVSIRIVDKEGEVIWAYTQESKGGKIKTPLADAMERAVKQLLRDLEKAEKKPEQSQ